MPSRINMGPDGGPYIAINENNGNIELEDNTGTTVAIWDDANSQWDFQNNPISNVNSLSSNSVNTGDLNIDQLGEWRFEDRDNVSADRSGDTTYQNSADATLWISVKIRVDGDTQTNINSQLCAAATAGGADEERNAQDGNEFAGVGNTRVVFYTALVPPDYYYRLRLFGDEEITRWDEGYLQ